MSQVVTRLSISLLVQGSECVSLPSEVSDSRLKPGDMSVSASHTSVTPVPNERIKIKTLKVPFTSDLQSSNERQDFLSSKRFSVDAVIMNRISGARKHAQTDTMCATHHTCTREFKIHCQSHAPREGV